MYVLILITIIFILYLIVEYIRHIRNVNSIPIRIHVNGTRGKSSVTRLLCSAFNAGGIPTIAKTTGTSPRMIFPYGSEASIERLFSANIIEQKYVFRYAAKLKPKAIVMECMAINPAFQWVTERKLVKSTIAVITNSRPDHLDLMGNNIDSVTRSLANTIPENGDFFTAESEQLDIFKEISQTRNSKLYHINSDDITDKMMNNFSYIEHKDNVALSLAICNKLDIKRETALQGMYNNNPDPGALRRYKVKKNNKEVYFYNVFAANDPESTVFIWNEQLSGVNEKNKMIILNTRADRYFRTIQLLEKIRELDFSCLMLTGERSDTVLKHAIKEGINKAKIEKLGEIEPEKILDLAMRKGDEKIHIFGIGNIAGKRHYGSKIVKYFYEHSKNNKLEDKID